MVGGNDEQIAHAALLVLNFLHVVLSLDPGIIVSVVGMQQGLADAAHEIVCFSACHSVG